MSTNHQADAFRKIKIEDYGYRRKFLGQVRCGEGRDGYLHFSDRPKTTHAAYRMLKTISMMPWCTRKEIQWACNQSVFYVGGYWASLHREGYIEQWKTSDNLIVYVVTEWGKKFIENAERNS